MTPRTLLPAAVAALAAVFVSGAGPLHAGARADLSGYQALLDRYVKVVSPKGRPADTRFDYEQLYVDEHIWRLKESKTLAAIREQLFAVPPARMDSLERRAWAINAYNFLVIEKLTLHLLIPGRQFMRWTYPREITGPQGGFYDAHCATVDGRAYSLHAFEQRFVHGDTTAAEGLPPADDPRVALALCAGMAGSPPIAPRAFRGESLHVQLEAQARRTLALDRFLRLDPETRRIWIGEALVEAKRDFGGDAGLWEFVQAHAPRTLHRAMAKDRTRIIGGVVPRDERINQVERRKGAPRPGDVTPSGS